MDTEEQTEQDDNVKKWPGGRPLKFQDIDAFRLEIQHYFESLEPHWEEYEDRRPVLHKDGKLKGQEVMIDNRVQYETVIRERMTLPEPPLITGLAIALGTTRSTLLDYENARADEFSYTIKAAKAVIEKWNERVLATGSAPAAGVIFNMVNNYSWKNVQVVEQTGNQKVTVERELNDEQLGELVARTIASGRPAAQSGAGARPHSPKP